MRTWLLTWNRKRGTWESYDSSVRRIRSGKIVSGGWSCGVNKSILPGDRVFLIALGLEPKGIVASGTVTSSPEAGAPWLGKPSRKKALYIDVDWDTLVDLNSQSQRPLSLQILLRPPFSRINWITQSSGIEIAGDVATRLEVAWAKHYRRVSGFQPVASSRLLRISKHDDELSAFEGGIRQLVIKHRIRERRLRQAKILQARRAGRLVCEVPRCGFDFERIYGELGSGFAEVHHCRPLSTLRKKTRTTLDDLKIVCSNCHRMIHHRGECRSLKNLIPKR
jgi:5-methylcytosine-specific restriction enzyme A